MTVFDIHSGRPLKQKTPCLIVGVWQKDLKTPLLAELDTLTRGFIERVVKGKEFAAKERETAFFHTADLPFQRLVLVGLGEKKKVDSDRVRRAAGKVASLLQEKRIEVATCLVDSLVTDSSSVSLFVRAFCEGMILGSYRFDSYRTEKMQDLPRPIKKISLVTSRKAIVEGVGEAAEEACAICRGVILARDLVNEPGNVKAPEFLARSAHAIAEETGMRCTVMEKDELADQGFGALLGVAQGSSRDPRLITLEYTGASVEERPIALIGKGVVFDAGGISLKPAEKMDEMKMDMGGAAAVLGTLLAASLLKLPVNLVGVIPAVENLPSGTAIRPGDILTSLSGRTIEVVNTDAEGRLILADALTYTKRFNPKRVIDLATLTGACIIALGHHATAVLGNNARLVKDLIAAGEESGERLWELPLWDDYAAQLKSEIADIKNIGGRPAGTITAAAFLKTFAEKFDWAHLDIAGTAWEESGRPYQPKGGTGVGVRLLIDLLR